MTLTAEERAWVEMMAEWCAARGYRVVGYAHTDEGLAVRLADIPLGGDDEESDLTTELGEVSR